MKWIVIFLVLIPRLALAQEMGFVAGVLAATAAAVAIPSSDDDDDNDDGD